MPPDEAAGRDLVLVTGASGFLGSAIADQLRHAGHDVRVLVREASPRRNISPADEVAIGDMRDPQAVARAMAGARYVVHAAADYRLWTRDPEAMVRTNVEGTRTIAESALRAGVERLVYTSSVATLRPGDDHPSDETCRLTPEQAIGPYKRSKVLAERVVEEMVDRQGLPAVIVSPSTPIGPRDIKPTPTGRIILEAARGRMPAFVDTGLNFAHVDDVANGHLLALRHGRIGERYILGGQNVTLAAMLAEIARQVQRRPPRVRLPSGIAYAAAVVSELIAGVTGREPLATRDGVRMSRHRMFFDDTRARRELGYTSRPYQEGIADALAWFRQEGYLK
jgi:dihydroflavonol-4-reductase